MEKEELIQTMENHSIVTTYKDSIGFDHIDYRNKDLLEAILMDLAMVEMLSLSHAASAPELLVRRIGLLRESIFKYLRGEFVKNEEDMTNIFRNMNV